MNLLTNVDFWQNVAIVTTLIIATYQVILQIRQNRKAIYTELNTSYLNFLQFCLDHPETGINDYTEEDIHYFEKIGGNRKMLDAINKMVALWEHAFLVKENISKNQWQGWNEWIDFHLQRSEKVRIGVTICLLMYDMKFQEFINRKLHSDL